MNLEQAKALGKLVDGLNTVEENLEQIERHINTSKAELKDIQMGPSTIGDDGVKIPENDDFDPDYFTEQSKIGQIKAIECHRDHLKSMKGELMVRIKKFDTSEH